ncbi:MAG: hypothetical protein AAGH38_07595 [Pseudomonadota bacterium]
MPFAQSAVRFCLALVASALTTLVLSIAFYTQRVIAAQQAIGANYTIPQQAQTYWDNFVGLGFTGAPPFGAVIVVALIIGFAVAFVVKRILTPLAAVAYPVAGASAVVLVIYLVDNVLLGGGTGAIGGARDSLGLGLQGVAGFFGGIVFAVVRP